MNLPTPYEVGIKRHVAGAKDAHGNKSESWLDPEFVRVYSIAPTSSQEPPEAGRGAVITNITVLAPPTVTVDRLDRIVIGEDEYTVEGEVGNWNQGPFGFTPGISITLKRVSG